MTSPPGASFRQVSKSWGATRAVDGLTFDVRPGEFFSLLGPSGSGKTTTLRLLAGLETPDPGGEVLIDGRPVSHLPPYERGLSMVFQHYALFPHLSVEGNVAFGLEQRRLSREVIRDRVRAALEQVRLDPDTFGRRRPGQLSGGQRQRVALARALVLEPGLLLLDEPLGAIDTRLRKDMQLELKALNRRLGITFVHVTHDQDEALAMSDRVAVMDRGRVVQVGSPAEIYERPRTAFVAGFIGEVNLLGPDQRVAVRPERMDLFPPDEVPPGRVALPGRVQDVIYLGDMLHVLVEVPDRPAVRVAMRNDGQLHRPLAWRPGDAVRVAWRPEDGHELEPEP